MGSLCGGYIEYTYNKYTFIITRCNNVNMDTDCASIDSKLESRFVSQSILFLDHSGLCVCVYPQGHS